MKGIYMADVGDGLCMAIETIFGQTLQIDCGGTDDKTAFHALDKIFDHFHDSSRFILSHFHIDHYNGLLYANLHKQSNFSAFTEVYYPKIPDFKENKEFLLKLFAINCRVFGSKTGVMEYDFLDSISKINTVKFKHKALSKGDTLKINGSIIEVLWPPKELNDKKTLRIIMRALRAFDEAKQEDDMTNRLYNSIKDGGVFDALSYSQLTEYKPRENMEKKTCEIRELPPVVKKANDALRKAANHLSLALFEDNKFLFLGDAEDYEIKQIVADLKSKTRNDFQYFITPHHGTHWDESLKEIKFIYSFTSIGKKLISKLKPEFKEISKNPFATFINGNIVMRELSVYCCDA